MGLAAVAHVLWTKIMRYDPTDPGWINRDRFVLSNGHACALQYIMLHLTGYNISIEDLTNHCKLDSITPGHPERLLTPGVEVTTGPLGQGLANGVGLAMAQAHLAKEFNKPDCRIFDNYTYVICGDGCLMEGISSEACSLAGHLGLNRLIVLYDDNHSSIDGPTELAFTEDRCARFRAFGWHTIVVPNASEDFEGVERAIREAHTITDRPVFIDCQTIIGYGSVNQGTAEVHGKPLQDDDVKNVKRKFGFDPDKTFFVPEVVQKEYRAATLRGRERHDRWRDIFHHYQASYPREAGELDRRMRGALPDGWREGLPTWTYSKDGDEATRTSSGKILNALARTLPELVGGAADLTPSTFTKLDVSDDVTREGMQNRYIRFGVREHAMVAICNGLAAYGGIIPFCASFLNFIEYCFPAVRLAAMSHHQQIILMTHDSIGLGEDGPTHQAVEAITTCRATPNVLTIRPADGNETAGAYIAALQNKNGPTVMCLTRQKVPQIQNSSAAKSLMGAYIVREAANPSLIIVASGSEVAPALEAAEDEALHTERVRVVSMPCWSLFEEQSVGYRREVFPPGVPVIAVEAAAPTGWERYSHYAIGMRTFGASAPAKDVFKKFNFTGPAIARICRDYTARHIETMKRMGITDNACFAPLPTVLYAWS